jgi:hypothetical protein
MLVVTSYYYDVASLLLPAFTTTYTLSRPMLWRAKFYHGLEMREGKRWKMRENCDYYDEWTTDVIARAIARIFINKTQ